MDKEKLINEIMKEFEADGEPVTRAEAEEIAEMEIKAKANNRRYEQREVKKKTAPKERKVDEVKKYLFGMIIPTLENEVTEGSLKNEAEYSFSYGGEKYTLKLIRHNPPKK